MIYKNYFVQFVSSYILIELFSLYVFFPLSDHVTVPQRIFFQFRPMHLYPHAYVCIIHERQKANAPENITSSELGNSPFDKMST